MPTEEASPYAQYAETLQNVVQPIVNAVTIAFPFIVQYTKIIYDFYQQLPSNVAKILFGFVLCFFGGIYPTLFAAFNAAKHGGMKELKKAISDLTEETMVILEESKKDDTADEDKDGVPDVKQITDKEYVLRKANLVVKKINPEKVDAALASLYTVSISVIATLKIQFARTIALSLSISDIVKRPANKYIAPIIQKAMPKEYQKWVPVVIGWTTKSIGMSIAWFIQTIISAITSAWEGALIISRSLLKICVAKGINPADIIPENHEETNIDETIAYVIAACGFYFQWSMGFDMPFPFNILLMPFEIGEYYIRWTISD